MTRTGADMTRALAARRRLALRWLGLLVAASIVAAGCSSADEPDVRVDDAAASRELAAEVGSFDLVVGRPDRFLLGLFSIDNQHVVAYGTVRLAFSYAGTRDRELDPPQAGPLATGTFLPLPGQRLDLSVGEPKLVQRSEAAGVYGAEDVVFSESGFWTVAATAVVDGHRRRTTAAFEVRGRSDLPAPGDPAPRTDNPVAGAPGVSPRAIDSRAGEDQPVPDPELHRRSITAALATHRPLMVVVSTPSYCQSRFCGPITDHVAALARRSDGRTDFVHLELWKDFDGNVMNEAAAAWIAPTPETDVREPWVFVVDASGRITARFDNVVTEAELKAAMQEVAP
jgi:hypothetical protein